MAKLTNTLNSCDNPEDAAGKMNSQLQRFQYDLQRVEKAGDLPADRKPVTLPTGFTLKIRIPEDSCA